MLIGIAISKKLNNNEKISFLDAKFNITPWEEEKGIYKIEIRFVSGVNGMIDESFALYTLGLFYTDLIDSNKFIEVLGKYGFTIKLKLRKGPRSD